MDARRLRSRSKTRSGKLKSTAAAWALAKGILRRAMLGYYGTATARAAHLSISLNQDIRERGVALEHFASRDDGYDELDEYLDSLERSCGYAARMIAENLIAPFGSCADRLAVEIAKKRRKQQRGKYKRSNPRVRISPRAVRDAMELDNRAWDSGLQEVRRFTRSWLGKTEQDT